MQRQVGVNHSDARDRRQVEATRHELRAQEDVGAPLAERLPDVEVRIGSFRSIAVQAQDASLLTIVSRRCVPIPIPRMLRLPQ
jgi:hypothetical protein